MPKTTLNADIHNLIREILREQGADACEGVMYQLAHYSHGFVMSLRSDAHDLTSGSEGVTAEHLQRAHELRAFSKNRIQQQDICRFAASVNQKPFPKIEPHQGLSLPHEQHCLLSNNFQYEKFEGVTVAERGSGSGRKRKGERREMEASEKTDEPRQASKRHHKDDVNDRDAINHVQQQIDFDQLEQELAAELEANQESADEIAEGAERDGSEDRSDEQVELQTEENNTNNGDGNPHSDAEEGQHGALIGERLRDAAAQPPLVPEKRTAAAAVLSMQSKN